MGRSQAGLLLQHARKKFPMGPSWLVVLALGWRKLMRAGDLRSLSPLHADKPKLLALRGLDGKR
jgi:hypothetical protein